MPNYYYKGTEAITVSGVGVVAPNAVFTAPFVASEIASNPSLFVEVKQGRFLIEQLNLIATGDRGAMGSVMCSNFPGESGDVLVFWSGTGWRKVDAGGADYASGTRLAFIGDSITAANSPYSPLNLSCVNFDSPARYTIRALGAGYTLVTNAGIGGNRTDQILARLDSEVLAFPVDICVIYSCTWNNIGQSRSLSSTLADISEMIDKCLAANVIPILCSPTPDGQLGTTSARVGASILWVRRFAMLAASKGVPFVDFFSPLVDTTSGNMKSAYLPADNSVHVNRAAQLICAQKLASVIRNCTPAIQPPTLSVGDLNDLLLGVGFFAADTDSNGVSNGIASGPASGTGFTWTRVSNATVGWVQRCTTSALAANATLTFTTPALVAGRRYEVSGYIGKTGTSAPQFGINFTTFDLRYRFEFDGTDPGVLVENGYFCTSFIAPENATGAYIITKPGTGTVDFAQLAIRDITAVESAV